MTRAHALLVAAALASIPAAADAQQIVEIRVIQLDPGFLCPSSGMPAMSPDGHRIALVDCVTAANGAQDVSLQVLQVPGGRVAQRVPLSHTGPGGAHPTAEATIARNVARANRVLAQGRFEPLQEIASPDMPMADATGAGITARYVIEAHQLLVEGVATARADIPAWPSTQPCCDGDGGACRETPVIRGAWVDPAAHFLLVRLASDEPSRPCAHVPAYRVVTLRHSNDRH